MPLQHLYRPKTLAEFVGNKSLVTSLKSVCNRKSDMPNAWMFVGDHGSGKTTLSRIVSDIYLGCKPVKENIDYVENDCAENGSVDFVRELKQMARYRPIDSKNRVFVLDEAHLLGSTSKAEKNIAQNALLKILEEPPTWCHIIICTTAPNSIIKTIRDRCHIFTVKPLSNSEMKGLIERILKSEKVDDFPDIATKKIIEVSNGHPRTALKILDQVIDVTNIDHLIEQVESFSDSESNAKQLVDALLKKESWKTVSNIIKDLKKSGSDPEGTRRMILNTASAILLNSNSMQTKNFEICMDIIDSFQTPTFDMGWPMITFSCGKTLF